MVEIDNKDMMIVRQFQLNSFKKKNPPLNKYQPKKNQIIRPRLRRIQNHNTLEHPKATRIEQSKNILLLNVSNTCSNHEFKTIFIK